MEDTEAKMIAAIAIISPKPPELVIVA